MRGSLYESPRGAFYEDRRTYLSFEADSLKKCVWMNNFFEGKTFIIFEKNVKKNQTHSNNLHKKFPPLFSDAFEKNFN